MPHSTNVPTKTPVRGFSILTHVHGFRALNCPAHRSVSLLVFVPRARAASSFPRSAGSGVGSWRTTTTSKRRRAALAPAAALDIMAAVGRITAPPLPPQLERSPKKCAGIINRLPWEVGFDCKLPPPPIFPGICGGG